MHIEKFSSKNDTSTVIDCALCGFDLKKTLYEHGEGNSTELS